LTWQAKWWDVKSLPRLQELDISVIETEPAQNKVPTSKEMKQMD
jgi:hypothetical protein